MPVVQQTPTFKAWHESLTDAKAKAAIAYRLTKMGLGLMGDVKSLGEGLHEAREHIGPGYRLYFTYQGRTIVVMLCGSDKSDQKRTISKARAMLKEAEK